MESESNLDFKDYLQKRSDEIFGFIHPVYTSLGPFLNLYREQLELLFPDEAREQGIDRLVQIDVEHITKLLKSGARAWNEFRTRHPYKMVLLFQESLGSLDLVDADLRNVIIWKCYLPGAKLINSDLSGAYLVESRLSGVDLRSANLRGAHLVEARIRNSDLSGTNLDEADFSQAWLMGSKFVGSTSTKAVFYQAALQSTNFSGAILLNANLESADLSGADFSDAVLKGANLQNAFAIKANFSNATLREANLNSVYLFDTKLVGANLESARLIRSKLTDTDLTDADLSHAVFGNATFNRVTLTHARIYDSAGWAVDSSLIVDQSNLIITEKGKVELTVNNLANAKIIYDMSVDQSSIARMTETTASKIVMLLGSFQKDRMEIMHILENALLTQNRIPLIFSFQADTKDWDESVNTFARLSGIIIPDLSAHGSVPQELKGIIEGNPRIVIQPIVESGHRPYSMFQDHFHPNDYPWVLPTVEYKGLKDQSSQELSDELTRKAILPAIAWAERRRQDMLNRRKIT